MLLGKSSGPGGIPVQSPDVPKKKSKKAGLPAGDGESESVLPDSKPRKDSLEFVIHGGEDEVDTNKVKSEKSGDSASAEGENIASERAGDTGSKEGSAVLVKEEATGGNKEKEDPIADEGHSNKSEGRTTLFFNIIIE